MYYQIRINESLTCNNIKVNRNIQNSANIIFGHSPLSICTVFEVINVKSTDR